MAVEVVVILVRGIPIGIGQLIKPATEKLLFYVAPEFWHTRWALNPQHFPAYRLQAAM